MARKSSNKSDFVRSQPASMAASEVVAKAKEAGIVITKGLVYVVRSSRSGKKMKSVKAGAGARSSKPSASEFIRSRPASASAKQVSDEGKKQGFSFKPALVYTVRRAQEKRENKASHAGKASGPRGASAASMSELRKLMSRFETLAAKVLRELK